MPQNESDRPGEQLAENPPSPAGPMPMELNEEGRETLEDVRRRILRSPDLPVTEDERSRMTGYRLRAAGPDQASVALEVEVVRGGIEGNGGAGETVDREVELTPQVVAESPGGLRYFAAWNHVARTFVIWLTPRSLEALRDDRRGEAT